MSSLAHTQRLSHYDVRERAERAEVGYQHLSFTIELLARVAKRIALAVQRWTAAHHQRVQDRLFWELALTDSRVMSELQAIRDHAEPQRTGD